MSQPEMKPTDHVEISHHRRVTAIVNYDDTHIVKRSNWEAALKSADGNEEEALKALLADENIEVNSEHSEEFIETLMVHESSIDAEEVQAC